MDDKQEDRRMSGDNMTSPHSQHHDPQDAEEKSQISTPPSDQVETLPPAPLDWSGPDDPENPHNWGFAKRAFHTMVPAISGFTVTFASSVYTPGYPDVMERFHVSSTASLLGLSLFVLGLACGPVIASPLSETFGRRIVYLTSLPIFALFTMGAGLSQNFGTLLVCRFMAGVFGSPPLAVGAGTNADLWPPASRGVATIFFVLSPFLGPALGPTIGGFVAERKDWRWLQWTIIFFAIASFIPAAISSETYKKVILNRRAKKLGIPLPPGPTGVQAMKFLLTVTFFRPIHMLFTEPIVGFFSLYVAFNFSVLFCFFAAFPYIYEGVYHFDRSGTGLTFLAIAVGCLIATAVVIVLDRVIYQKQVRLSHKDSRNGVVAPEHRLYPAMIGSIALPIALFWFAWTAKPSVHWISPVIATVPFAFANLAIFSSSAMYLVDTYGALNGASALAANGLLRYTFGAAFPLFTIQMYKRLGIDWATSLLGFISIALLPVPWVLF
ncbi:MAG: Rab proteins geranylgeranyltransferase component A, partial [Chaenotheca gracillima]